jgi:hypothetical protein
LFLIHETFWPFRLLRTFYLHHLFVLDS